MYSTMSQWKQQYQAFNQIYNDLFLKLIEFFPNAPKLKFYHNLLEEFIKSDYRLPGRLFLSNVGPYCSYIIAQDEQFFKQELFGENKERFLHAVVLQEWDNMEENQKQLIWFYMNRLLMMITEIDEDDDSSSSKIEETSRTIMDTLQEK